MDRGSLIGLGLAGAAIFGGQAMEGGHISIFLQPSAFVIVVVGTLAAVLLHYPLPVFMRGIRMAKWAFKPPASEAEAIIRRIVQWSHTARQESPLALEKYLHMTRDPYQKTGLQLLIDGADAGHARRRSATQSTPTAAPSIAPTATRPRSRCAFQKSAPNGPREPLSRPASIRHMPTIARS